MDGGRGVAYSGWCWAFLGMRLVLPRKGICWQVIRKMRASFFIDPISLERGSLMACSCYGFFEGTGTAIEAITENHPQGSRDSHSSSRPQFCLSMYFALGMSEKFHSAKFTSIIKLSLQLTPCSLLCSGVWRSLVSETEGGTDPAGWLQSSNPPVRTVLSVCVF